MDLKTFNKMKSKIKKALKYMLKAGYKEDNLKVVLNQKYKGDKFFDNIYLEYENFMDNVDFMIVPKYSTFLKDRYPFKESRYNIW